MKVKESGSSFIYRGLHSLNNISLLFFIIIENYLFLQIRTDSYHITYVCITYNTDVESVLL